MSVLVVASSQSLTRDLAGRIEAERDEVSAVTATSPERAVDRLERSEIDGVVVSTEGFGSDSLQVVGTIDTSSDDPVVVAVGGTDVARRAAIAAGAADAVEEVASDENVAVLANRLEMAIRAAQAEQTATETQHRYHRLLEASPAAIVVYDDEGAIQYANPAAADLVGADDAYEVVGRDLSEFVVADSQSTARERFERIVEDREPVEPRELGLEGPDGERRYVESAASPVPSRASRAARRC